MNCPICGSPINESTNRCSRFPVCHYVASKDSRMNDDEFIAFDLETTGLDKRNSRIIEIGAIHVKNGKVIDSFSSLLNPGKDSDGNQIFIPFRITKITGISNEMVEDKPDEKEGVQQFLKWAGNTHVYLGQNITTFDIPFMKFAAKRAGMIFQPTHVIDTLVYAKKCRLKDRGLVDDYKQPTLAKHYNFTYNAHRAVDDIRACYQIYLRMKDEAKTFGINVVPLKISAR